MAKYNGFKIDHTPPSWCRDAERVRAHYTRKAKSYSNLALALERRARRGGKRSKEYARYLKLLETSLEYSTLGKRPLLPELVRMFASLLRREGWIARVERG